MKDQHTQQEEFCPVIQDRAYFEKQLKHCLEEKKHNEELFDMETEPELIEAHIYRRLSLECEYRYLLRQVKESEKPQPRPKKWFAFG